MSTTDLTMALKRLIVDSCEKDFPPEALSDDEPLFGPDARLALDSLDALQLSMALQKRYGVRLTDSKETRRILASVASLADYLQDKVPGAT
ncbi:phosphopantetheine-binding protein [Niveibacterium sp.]|uniref:phosphopantetheine-binding protein n=1 Tax=Niveibacterium sp. TaxID=2017444 RepID=UPI0035B0BD61